MLHHPHRFERGLGPLSDPAFTVHAWDCLHAGRAGGRLRIERVRLVPQLGKTPPALGRHLPELLLAGVCKIESPLPLKQSGSLLLVRNTWRRSAPPTELATA